MKKSLIAIVAALALSPLAAHAQSRSYYPYSAPRSPWYFSLGLGTGTGWTHGGGTTSSFHDILTYGGTPGTSDDGRIGFNFQVGATVTPRLLMGFDLTLLHGFGDLLDQNGYFYDTYVQIWNGDLMLTFFPMERGLFLRGGMGLSNLSTGISAGGTTFPGYHYSGFNCTLGVGYAFPLTPNLNLTLTGDYSRQWYGSNRDYVSGSSFFLVHAGLAWY